MLARALREGPQSTPQRTFKLQQVMAMLGAEAAAVLRGNRPRSPSPAVPF